MIYVSFILNKRMPLHLWSPLDGTHELNQGKQRNVYYKQDRYMLQKFACPIALEYGLNDLLCSTEWTDMRYKCIRDLV